MNLVIAIIGLILLAAWIEQVIAQRARRRSKPVKWWKDPDDEGDY